MNEHPWEHMSVRKPEVGQLIEWQSPMDDGMHRGIYGEDGWCTPLEEDEHAWAKCQPPRWRPAKVSP